MVKCLLAMGETQVRSLGWEDLLEKEMATYSSIPAWRIPGTEEPGRLTVHGVAKSRTQLSDFTFTLNWERDTEISSSCPFSFQVHLSGLPSMGSHRVGHE